MSIYVNMFSIGVVKYQLFVAMKFEYKVLKVEIENPANLVVIPNVPTEFTPSIGKEFELNEIKYNFYNEYGEELILVLGKSMSINQRRSE